MTRHARSKVAGSKRRGRDWQRLERLESRRLLAVASDHDELHDTSFDDAGRAFVRCDPPTPAVVTSIPSVATKAAAAVAPLADTFLLHSQPTASTRIYLDFDGHVTTGTGWQGGKSFTTPAYSLDADFTTFSDAEKEAIQDVWARVSEDFVPFDVDVTTEAPTIDDLQNTGGGDTRWGIRVVIGGDGAWMSGAAGVAYIGSFTWGSDTPCYCFAGQWWKTDFNFIASCVSHEVGHSLGLNHDGYNGSTYYGGRGSGATSWGPLMGNPDTSLTQWSKGDYGGSTNKEDDLAIIVKDNGFGYRPDDHGDTIATATMATVAQFTVPGIIGSRTDVDMIGFTATAGTLNVTVKPLAAGANLDALARLLDAAGNVVATSNPVAAIDASFAVNVTAGKYYISVDGTGMGDPNTTGYTDYGSLGQYTLTVGAPVGPLPTLSVADVTIAEGNAGTKTATLTVTLSAPPAAAVSVAYATANGTATTADGDYTAATGTVSFAAGETQKTVTLTINGDTKVEVDETFTVGFSSAINATLGRSSATVTITNDDIVAPPPNGTPTLTVQNVVVAEGNSGTTTATLTFTLSAAAKSAVTVKYVTANGTATAADRDYVAAAGTVSFAVGEMQKTVVLKINGDAKIEADETFIVALSNVVGATLARSAATVTITNDDTAAVTPTVVLDGPATVAEGDTGLKPVRYRASLSQPVGWVTQVRYTVVAGTAANGVDFFAPRSESVLVFAANQTVAWMTVDVAGDRRVEPNETFRIQLSGPVGLSLGSAASKTVTIVDDDAVVIHSVPPASRLSATVFAALAMEWQSGGTAGRRHPRS